LPCMNINEHNALPLKKRIFKISIFYLAGFTLFFLCSLIIIIINVKTREKVRVPSLVGKLYLEEHNRLMNSGLHIEMEKTNLLEYPYGYILSQSIAQGEIVSEGTRLVLLTNDNKKLVPVPNLVGVSELIAPNILATINVGKASFSLTVGTITRIPNQKPAGEVLAQFPPEGTPVIPDSPVSILVSEGPEKLKTGYVFPDVKNVNVEILKKISYDIQIPIKILPVTTHEFRENGLIEEIDFNTGGSFISGLEKNKDMQPFTVKVKKYNKQGEKIFPNAWVWVSVEDNKMKGKAATVFEKTTDNSEYYMNPGYAVFDKLWPVFYQRNISLESWEGYQEKEKIISVDTKPEDTSGKNLNSAEHSIVDPDYSKRIKGSRI